MQFPNHLIFSISALPGINSHVTTSSGFINFLLITNATPALARGVVGCSDAIIVRFFLNFVCICSSILWSRCVSCATSIAIFSICIVLLICFHLFRNVMFSDGAAAPFRFWDAILMLALDLRFLGCSFSSMFPWLVALCPGAGTMAPGWEWSVGWGPGGGAVQRDVPLWSSFMGIVLCMWLRRIVIAFSSEEGYFILQGSKRIEWCYFGYVHSRESVKS